MKNTPQEKPANKTISYKSDDIEIDVDREIKNAMKKLGWSCYATGYDLIESRRDICFEYTR